MGLTFCCIGGAVLDDDAATPSTELGIRLVDGPNAKSGLVEVMRSEWRSVCDDYWTEEDANVVCRQLGFLGFGE